MRDSHPNRRSFLMHATAATTAAASAASLDISLNAYAGGLDTLRIGLVGCGGRGTGAADQALSANPANRLVAMADAFEDRLQSSLGELKNSEGKDRVDVPAERQFVGLDAYKNVIDQVDVVLLTTPPHFRPEHFSYAVAKGIHAFVEKPMAVDVPGLRKYLEAAKLSKEKGLSAVNGFCWRYHDPRRQTIKRVHDGQIGKIIAIETTYNSQGVWDPRFTREQCASDMEYQMRNWYYYCWLSGDHIVEQAVHGIDTMAWVMGDKRPARCWAVGGRQARTDPKYGNIWDHFSVVYEYPDDVRGYHHCRHWAETPTQVKDYVLGSTGVADVFGNRITGPNEWRHRGDNPNMYQVEHNEMNAAIREGKPINNAEEAAVSTLLAIMGRQAAYTGEVISWEQAMNSVDNLSPAGYGPDDAPNRPVPVPGITKFS